MKLFYMKKFLFAIAFLVGAQYSFSQQTTETFDLKGKVRFVEESSYEFIEKFGEVELGDFLGRECKVFNEKGFLIKKYKINGNKESKDTVDIEINEFIFNENGKIKELNEYEQYSYRYPKKLKYKTRNKFDESGKLVQLIVYNGDGSFHNGYEYTYENDKMVAHEINSYGTIITQSNDLMEVYTPSIDVDPFVEGGDEDVSSNKDQLDAYENWIKRIEYIGKKPVKGHDRKIIYF